LLGGVAVKPVCFPLQGREVVKAGRVLGLFLPYAQMLHAEPLINYWLDILCMGDISERQELFLKDRKKVEEIAGKVCAGRKRIMGCSRGSA